MSRHVIISGGGTGIGRATASRFAEDGDRVVLVGRRGDKLRAVADEVAASGTPEPVTVTADLADPASASAAASTIAGKLGHVDVLVAAAGGSAALSDVDQLDRRVPRLGHWLASPAAAQITAQIIQLNGGAELGR